ncbi:MAG: hypothetical protein NTV25_04040 [Methanothrix sp.]|nr:hypothetical protein [Methanothrix sp.]
MELRPQEIEAAIKFFQKNRNREMTLAEALRLAQNLPSQRLPDVESPLPILGLQAEGQIEEMLSALSDPGGRGWSRSALPRGSRAPCGPTSFVASPGFCTCTGSAWGPVWRTIWAWERPWS